MTDDRISTEIWLSAALRRCSALGIPAYVMHRGAGDSGTVMLKIVSPSMGHRLLNQARDQDGKMGWMDIFAGENVDEAKIDAYIQRSLSRDPDLWVVEVETRDGTHPFEGKVF